MEEADKNISELKSQVGSYLVLARKYRPTDFSSLIGQDAMVQTLTNAFDSKRLAHAYILTGVRGVGKTTTARIIAKALCCVGENGKGKETINPCGKCDMCIAISEDRLMDVMEMDAASRRGISDIRELIDGVRYKPVSARYKIYILDEVHMLTSEAFNALLKTLEEPPPHVKFIFATTEIRKVPLTVLSRCQRFDLRRVSQAHLSEHFREIIKLENAKITSGALELICRVADGSVRDGQSLLDQVVTTSLRDDRELDESDVRELLGLGDKNRIFELLTAIFGGEVEAALSILDEDYKSGSDPLMVVQDLLESIHTLTRMKIGQGTDLNQSVSDEIRALIEDLSVKLTMADLSRAWQVLIKGLQEIKDAPDRLQAVEMIILRLIFISDLPSPSEAIKLLDAGEIGQQDSSGNYNAGSKVGTGSITNTKTASNTGKKSKSNEKHSISSFQELINILDEENERILMLDLVNNARLESFNLGKIEISLIGGASRDIPQRLQKFIREKVRDSWAVSLTSAGTHSETLSEQKKRTEDARRAQIYKHPWVQKVQENFPGATIQNYEDLGSFPEEKDERGSK